MSLPLILRLDAYGKPVRWIPWQEAACCYSRDMVAWIAGTQRFTLHGGQSRATGRQSLIEINSIIAIRGEHQRRHQESIPPLNNAELFRRDHYTCLYCGQSSQEGALTRDHVIPLSRGGLDGWSNVVTACRRCNTHKAHRTPDEAGLHLLAIPYVPNLAEYLVLRNRRILADQMEFLAAQFHPQRSRTWKYGVVHTQ